MRITIKHTSAFNGFRVVGKATQADTDRPRALLRLDGLTPDATSSFDYDFEDPGQALAAVSRATNTYGELDADLWAAIEPGLHPGRASTAITTGDQIVVDGCVYNVESVGFSVADDEEKA